MVRKSKFSDRPGETPVRFTAHPPERRRRIEPVILPCACCSCCCCCLHSLGSLVGGIVGSMKPLDLPPRDSSDPDFPFPFRRDEVDDEGAVLPAAILYWLLLSLLLGVGAAWAYLAGSIRRTDDLFGAFAIAIMLLPVPQLGASLLSLIAVSLFYADRRAALARIAKITLYSFLGTMIGLGLMGCFCGLLSIPGLWR
jgi:hypothetical protein